RPHHVRRYARSLDGRAVPRALAGRMPGVREEAVTEVAERIPPMVREEAVLAMPALPVSRVERVDVDVPSVAVERVALARGAEAVDAAASIREPAEQVAVSPVGPVLVHREDGERAAPMREVELTG